MLHQPVSRIGHPGTIEPPTTGRVDRSMDVLQYATAFCAIVCAVLLAALR
jgi:hypothetical protein